MEFLECRDSGTGRLAFVEKDGPEDALSGAWVEVVGGFGLCDGHFLSTSQVTSDGFLKPLWRAWNLPFLSPVLHVAEGAGVTLGDHVEKLALKHVRFHSI